MRCFVLMAKKEKKPQYLASPLNNPMKNYEVYYMSPFEKVLYALLLLGVGGAVGLVFYGGLFKVDGDSTTVTYISNAIVFFGVGFLTIKFFLPAINEKLLSIRKKSLQDQFMNFLETLSVSLVSGNTMHDAIINSKADLLNQYSEGDMIIVELTEIINGVTNGKTIEEMLENFGLRSTNEDIINFSNVISNCYRLGGNFAHVVRHTREIISDKIAVSEEISTKISSNKLQLNVMCIMPIALVALLKATSADFASNLASFLGVFVTTVAIAIFVAAYFWGQKIIDIR